MSFRLRYQPVASVTFTCGIFGHDRPQRVRTGKGYLGSLLAERCQKTAPFYGAGHAYRAAILEIMGTDDMYAAVLDD